MIKRISLVLGKFHKDQTETMLKSALEKAKEMEIEIVDQLWVPGAFEMPLAVKRQFEGSNVDASVVLGIIEKGETKRGMVLAQGLVDALISLQLEYMKPVGFGIVGPDIMPSQIEPRLRSYAAGAVAAVGEMIP